MATHEAQTHEDANLALLSRCRMNDPEACSELFARYNRKIFNTAYRILGEESSAEDALQETFLNVYRGISSFRGESKISTWISRITINVCLGMLRREKIKPGIELDDESTRGLPADPTPSTDPMAYTLLEEKRALVREVFRKMSEKQRIVVRLHDMEGYTIQEISEIIDCPPGTVKSRLFYGRQEFKTILRDLTSGNFETAAAAMN